MRYRYIILDAMNHAHRSWWGCRESVTTDGRDNSLEKGFVWGLRTFTRGNTGAALVLAWDGKPIRQRAEQPDYRAHPSRAHDNRPADWHARCANLREVLAPVFMTLFDPTDEADVEIARFVRAYGGPALIVSTDSDLHMLLSEQVDILHPGPSSEVYHAQDFHRDQEFPPPALLVFRALTGDRTDNIHGLPYFPKKTARMLAAQYGTVDALYAALRQPQRPAFFAALTKTQEQKLLDGEAQVRSNARLLDLLAVSGKPHLSLPTRNMCPLRTLLTPLELGELAGTIQCDLLFGGGAVLSAKGAL
jgi:DNA polymerase I